MIDATQEDLDLFGSLKGNATPPGTFIGDGDRVVRKMLARGWATRVLCAPRWAKELEFSEDVEVRVALHETLNSIVGYRLHAGVMALGRIPEQTALEGKQLLVALDSVSNAENVGSLLRSAAAFGVDGLIVGPGTASPWLRRAVRVSMGAVMAVPIHVSHDLVETCRPLNAWAAHIHGERRDFREVDYTAPVCLVLGGEADGVSPRVLASCRGAIYIPMAGGWDCLNVAASAAVLLAEVQRQRAQGSGHGEAKRNAPT